VKDQELNPQPHIILFKTGYHLVKDELNCFAVLLTVSLACDTGHALVTSTRRCILEKGSSQQSLI